MSRPDAVVVGAGVIGCAVAFELARRGLSVELLERDGLASQASGAAAGMLAPLAESREGDALRTWGWRSLEKLPALAADLLERSGIDSEWVPSGVLRVARREEDALRLQEQARSDAAYGVEWIDAGAARAAAPGLAEDCLGAFFSPHEGHVRSPLLARAFARAAEQLGARLRVGEVVRDPGALDAGAVVVCAGCWTPSLGLELPIEPLRGQILSLDAPSPPFAPIVWERETYLVPKRDGSVVVGATEERVGFDCRTTTEGVAGLIEAAAALVPGLRRAAFRSAWAGLRPATPDALPAIGPVVGYERLFVAAGHHRNGVLLSPVTAELIADLVEGKELPADAAAFAPNRF
jgi:glycine oxidase